MDSQRPSARRALLGLIDEPVEARFELSLKVGFNKERDAAFGENR